MPWVDHVQGLTQSRGRWRSGGRSPSLALAVCMALSGGLHVMLARLTPALAPILVSPSLHGVTRPMHFELRWTAPEAPPPSSATAPALTPEPDGSTERLRSPVSSAPSVAVGAIRDSTRSAPDAPATQRELTPSAALALRDAPARQRELVPQDAPAPRKDAAPILELAPSEPALSTTSPLDLRPTQVARAFLGELAPPATAGSPIASLTADERGGATNVSVAASLRPAAPPSRPDPVLVRRGDGSYAFKGNGFAATIAHDGSVRMNDMYGRLKWLLVPMHVATFDLYALLDHAFGNDPFNSERVWFFNGTRALRERLAEQAAVQSTRTRLLRIWSVPGASLGERKRRTFAVWDECTEDASGLTGRGVVEGFVRESCPADGARSFTPQELDALNATRNSRARFAPYSERSVSERARDASPR